MNAIERTHPVIDPDVNDAEDAPTDDAPAVAGSRRSLIGAGAVGAGVLGAAIAFGGQRVSATTAPISEDDVALVSYAIGLELAVRDLYQAAIDSGVEGTAWPLLRQQHASYAERLAGQVAVSADTRNDDVYEANVDAFTNGSPANAGFPIENTAAATHTELLGLVSDVELAETIAAIAAMESRHAAFLAERSGRGDDFDALFSNPASPLLPEASS
jgi:rubrerythrin